MITYEKYNKNRNNRDKRFNGFTVSFDPSEGGIFDIFCHFFLSYPVRDFGMGVSRAMGYPPKKIPC